MGKRKGNRQPQQYVGTWGGAPPVGGRYRGPGRPRGRPRGGRGAPGARGGPAGRGRGGGQPQQQAPLTASAVDKMTPEERLKVFLNADNIKKSVIQQVKKEEYRLAAMVKPITKVTTQDIVVKYDQIQDPQFQIRYRKKNDTDIIVGRFLVGKVCVSVTEKQWPPDGKPPKSTPKQETSVINVRPELIPDVLKITKMTVLQSVLSGTTPKTGDDAAPPIEEKLDEYLTVLEEADYTLFDETKFMQEVDQAFSALYPAHIVNTVKDVIMRKIWYQRRRADNVIMDNTDAEADAEILGSISTLKSMQHVFLTVETLNKEFLEATAVRKVIGSFIGRAVAALNQLGLVAGADIGKKAAGERVDALETALRAIDPDLALPAPSADFVYSKPPAFSTDPVKMREFIVMSTPFKGFDPSDRKLVINLTGLTGAPNFVAKYAGNLVALRSQVEGFIDDIAAAHRYVPLDGMTDGDYLKYQDPGSDIH